MNERDVLLGILGIVKKHVDTDSIYGADVGIAEMEERIRKMPPADFPLARKALLEARDEIRASPDLRESMVRLVQVNCDMARIQGLQKGMAVGIVRHWCEQPENWGALVEACKETVAYIDRHVKP